MKYYRIFTSILLVALITGSEIMAQRAIVQSNVAVQNADNAPTIVVENKAEPWSVQSKVFPKETNSPEKKTKCVFNCNLLIQLVAVLIAIGALIWNIRQSNISNNHAKESYDAFITKSEEQFSIQKKTLETIQDQTDKIFQDNKTKNFIGYLSECYTTSKLVRKYLIEHFYDMVWNTTETKNFLFDLLQPMLKSATALKIAVTSETGFNDEFINAINTCVGLGDMELSQRIDVESLIEQLSNSIIIFEKQLNTNN